MTGRKVPPLVGGQLQAGLELPGGEGWLSSSTEARVAGAEIGRVGDGDGQTERN